MLVFPVTYVQFSTSGHSDALTLSPERQSALTSKITNDDLSSGLSQDAL